MFGSYVADAGNTMSLNRVFFSSIFALAACVAHPIADGSTSADTSCAAPLAAVWAGALKGVVGGDNVGGEMVVTVTTGTDGKTVLSSGSFHPVVTSGPFSAQSLDVDLAGTALDCGAFTVDVDDPPAGPDAGSTVDAGDIAGSPPSTVPLHTHLTGHFDQVGNVIAGSWEVTTPAGSPLGPFDAKGVFTMALQPVRLAGLWSGEPTGTATGGPASQVGGSASLTLLVGTGAPDEVIVSSGSLLVGFYDPPTGDTSSGLEDSVTLDLSGNVFKDGTLDVEDTATVVFGVPVKKSVHLTYDAASDTISGTFDASTSVPIAGFIGPVDAHGTVVLKRR